MKINDNPGICMFCKQTVYAKEGYIERSALTNSWKIIHKECYEAAAKTYLDKHKERNKK